MKTPGGWAYCSADWLSVLGAPGGIGRWVGLILHCVARGDAGCAQGQRSGGACLLQKLSAG